jgi:transcriptional regulator with XRE-family HTH domain
MNNPTAPAATVVDLNRVVAYNIRVARSLRGWTQLELAERLEPYLGRRLTQASVSQIERAWHGPRRANFDAHELLVFALVFDLPMTWFLLPPLAGNWGANGNPEWLLERVFGNDAQARAVCERLSEFAAEDFDCAVAEVGWYLDKLRALPSRALAHATAATADDGRQP